MTDTDYVPPHSLEAEAAVLGAILVQPSIQASVASRLDRTAFYAHNHERIFAAIEHLAKRGEVLDVVSVGEALRDRNLLEKCGGMAYLRSLMTDVPTGAHGEHYARIVQERAQLRAVGDAAYAILRIVAEGPEDVGGSLDRVERVMRDALAAGRVESGGRGSHAAVMAAVERIGQATAVSGSISTPWPKLNAMIGGGYPGEVCVWAAAPAMGKSGAVLQLADWIAAHHGQVAIFPLEMGEEATVDRWVASYSEIQTRRMRRGDLNNDDLGLISDAASKLVTRPIEWYSRRTRSMAAIRRELRKLALRGPISAVIIDHANFIAEAAGGNKRISKHERLDEIYTELQNLADEMGFWLHVVQHLNRESYKPAPDGRVPEPTAAGLRDGGNLEGIANTIVFPHRDYPTHDSATIRGEGRFVVAKARDGDNARIPMAFLGSRGLWLERYEDDTMQPIWFEEAS